MPAHLHVPFFGRLRTKARAGPFVLSETWYAGGEVLRPHAHEHPYACFVLEGVFAERRAGEDVTCPPLTVVMYPAGQEHEDRFLGTFTRCHSVEIVDPEVASWGGRAVTRGLVDDRGGPLAWLAGRLYAEARGACAADALLIEGLAHELLAAAASTVEPDRALAPPIARRAACLLRESFVAPPLMRDVAGSVGVHPVYLARVFRRVFGCSVGEYVRRLRVEHAYRELARSDRSLADIARSAGFADQPHLTRTFRKLVGVTPARLRALLHERRAPAELVAVGS